MRRAAQALVFRIRAVEQLEHRDAFGQVLGERLRIGAVRLAGVGRESGLLHDVLQAARREHQEPVFLAVMAEAGRQVEAPALATVMAGLGPAIHAFAALQGGRLRDAVSAALPRGAPIARESWMASLRPAMTSDAPGGPPTLIQVGSAERLLADATRADVAVTTVVASRRLRSPHFI